jgi:hypothetical protein
MGTQIQVRTTPTFDPPECVLRNEANLPRTERGLQPARLFRAAVLSLSTCLKVKTVERTQQPIENKETQ